MDHKLKINEGFAKKYNKYREKEELQKLKSRYGDIDLDDDSSESESEDENADAVTPALERGFFKTLACLKRKDPSIYDKSKLFYDEKEESDSESETEQPKKQKPMYLKDYERKVILENEGKFLDDVSDNDEQNNASPSYLEEQEQLKADLKKAINTTEGDAANDDLLVKRNKSSVEEEREEEDFRQWLKTPEAQLNLANTDKAKSIQTAAEEVSTLKEYWSDPKLDDGEKFLRDYILERKYLDKVDENPTYEDVIGENFNEGFEDSEDELFQKKSEVFEHKYNFRFEEPDQEFMKSYPRTIGNSVRRKDDSRKQKREDRKKKMEEQKKKKQEELKQLKSLKKKEIMDRIIKLQEATGNKDIAFTEADLQADFDPAKHDERMQEVFGDYDEDFDEEKPVFSDLDEMEDYEKYWDEDETYSGANGADCEDPDFIMDCDYDPMEHQKRKDQRKIRKGKQVQPNSGENINKSKKSAFYESVAKEKPVFDPGQKSFEKFLDEYYALDYEDLIGDLPCRFKYRQVVPNNFGLSTDEILGATDKELNAWCSLKRTVQYRKENDEIHDVKKYRRKGNNLWKKARVLRSVYETPGHDTTDGAEDVSNEKRHTPQTLNTMSSRKRKRIQERHEKMKMLQDDMPSSSQDQSQTNQPEKSTANVSIKNQSHKGKLNDEFKKVTKLSQDRLKAYGLDPKRYLKKLKYGPSKNSGS